MSTNRKPAEILRAAGAMLLGRVAAYRAEEQANPYWELGYAAGVDNAMGGAGGRLAMLFTPEAAEGLAALLKEVARTADGHEVDPGYAGMPDFRWCRGCNNEECDGLQALDKALAVAAVILGETTGQAT